MHVVLTFLFFYFAIFFFPGRLHIQAKINKVAKMTSMLLTVVEGMVTGIDYIRRGASAIDMIFAAMQGWSPMKGISKKIRKLFKGPIKSLKRLDPKLNKLLVNVQTIDSYAQSIKKFFGNIVKKMDTAYSTLQDDLIGGLDGVQGMLDDIGIKMKGGCTGNSIIDVNVIRRQLDTLLGGAL